MAPMPRMFQTSVGAIMKKVVKMALCPYCNREVPIWNYRDGRIKLRWHYLEPMASQVGSVIGCEGSMKTLVPPKPSEKSES
jgi:hypothetical protein